MLYIEIIRLWRITKIICSLLCLSAVTLMALLTPRHRDLQCAVHIIRWPLIVDFITLPKYHTWVWVLIGLAFDSLREKHCEVGLQIGNKEWDQKYRIPEPTGAPLKFTCATSRDAISGICWMILINFPCIEVFCDAHVFCSVVAKSGRLTIPEDLFLECVYVQLGWSLY